jgi:acetyl-CoA C-acetyltransferase
MMEAFVVAAVRTPVGRRGGALAHMHPADLSAVVLRELIERSGVDPSAIDDVLMGCVGQVGAQASNIARTAVLSAGLPETVPGTTIDRQCGSSQQAVHFAAASVASGMQDLVIAAGVEVMSLVPLGSATTAGEAAQLGHPRKGQSWQQRFGNHAFTQFAGADLIAERWKITREQMEVYALESHRRAITAQEEHSFADEIIAVNDMADDSRLTAATSSQLSDGAAGLLIASARAVQTHNLKPIARISAADVIGSDPYEMLSGTIPATRRALKKAGLSMADIGHFEVNEAFASVVLAWQKELNADPETTNPLGGAIALGHPLGATGARLMTSLVHAMRRNQTQWGLQVMCEGGGMANATVLELLT